MNQILSFCLKNGLHLILEIKGFEDDQELAKYAGAKRWVSAANNWGQLGQWKFYVCKNPQQLRHVTGIFRT